MKLFQKSHFSHFQNYMGKVGKGLLTGRAGCRKKAAGYARSIFCQQTCMGGGAEEAIKRGW